MAKEGALLVSFISMGLLFSTHLLPCFNFYYSAYCRGPAAPKQIALTFDDGPNEPYTSQILDILKKQHVKATFFIVGLNATRYPQVVKRIQEEGHIIGNHTFSHSPLLFKNKAEIQMEIENWEKVMDDIGIHYSHWFRAPHGWRSPFLPSVLQERGYRLAGWTRGVWDSDKPGIDVLYHRLSKGVAGGDIILLHDGEDIKTGADRSQTVGVLPQIIGDYKNQGFRFVTLTEMATQRDGLVP